jgi:hypothetical protein
MNRLRIPSLSLMFAICLSAQTSTLFAGESYHGQGTLVWSRHMYGVVCNNSRVRRSGSVTGTLGKVNAGLWYSNVVFGNGMVMEIDPFVSVFLPIGKLSTSLGLTVYTYDFNNIMTRRGSVRSVCNSFYRAVRAVTFLRSGAKHMDAYSLTPVTGCNSRPPNPGKS